MSGRTVSRTVSFNLLSTKSCALAAAHLFGPRLHLESAIAYAVDASCGTCTTPLPPPSSLGSEHFAISSTAESAHSFTGDPTCDRCHNNSTASCLPAFCISVSSMSHANWLIFRLACVRRCRSAALTGEVASNTTMMRLPSGSLSMMSTSAAISAV